MMVNIEDDPRKAQMRAQFNAIVADYDTAGPASFAHFGRRLVEFVGVEPGQRVLDVAAGRGAVLFPAAERVGETGEVVGVDLADGMVDALKAEAARRGIRAEIRVMDAESLEFPGGVFDRVFSGFGVMFFPDLPRALAEFRRVLKPGGRIGVSTWRVTQAEDLGCILEDMGLGRHATPGWITEPDALAGPLERAGFTDVRVVIDSQTFRYADLDEYWQSARGTGVRRLIAQLDATQTERARAALAERLAPNQKPDGLYVEATALLAVASQGGG